MEINYRHTGRVGLRNVILSASMLVNSKIIRVQKMRTAFSSKYNVGLHKTTLRNF